jgi:hypothetical protein
MVKKRRSTGISSCRVTKKNSTEGPRKQQSILLGKCADFACPGFLGLDQKGPGSSPYAWRLIRNSPPEITFVFKYRPLSTAFYLQALLDA